VASWSQHKRSGLQSVKCPVHGCLVVRRADGSWVMKCQVCLAEAKLAFLDLQGWWA
jgi:hypothetical protein